MPDLHFDLDPRQRRSSFLEDHALFAEAHASLGRSFVRAVLQTDHVLVLTKLLLREMARVSFGLPRPEMLAGVTGA